MSQALDWLADLGYDPQFGARPLKRVLQREVINELSKLVIAGEFPAGSTVYIDTKDDELVFLNEPFEGAAPVEPIVKPEPEPAKEEVVPKQVENQADGSERKNETD